jgi:hypothetical protein
MKKLKSLDSFLKAEQLPKNQMMVILGGASYRSCVCSTADGPCGDEKTTDMQDDGCGGPWTVVRESIAVCI